MDRGRGGGMSTVPSMVAAVRRIQPVRRPHDDTVLAIGVLHPHALSAAEAEIAAEWEHRSDIAIRQVRAEHERVRGVIARLGEGRR